MIGAIHSRRWFHWTVVLFLLIFLSWPGYGSQQDSKPSDEAAKLYKQVENLVDQGKYDDALPLAEQVLAICERTLGAEHIAVASVLNTLSSIYRVKGNYKKAEEIGLRSLVMRQKLLGKDHPLVAQSLNSLGILYDTKGDYVKAEEMLQRALEIREKALGAEHPLYAQSLNNLANLYRDKGDYARAEPLYLRALEIRQKAPGAEHLEVAISLNNLAILYSYQREYAKAETLFLQSLAIREKILGKDHPDIASSLNNIALLLIRKGDYARAEEFFLRSMDIRAKILGTDHPLYGQSLANLANLYRQKGDYMKAEPLYLRALAIREKAFGKTHPLVAALLNSLSIVYLAKGDIAQAVAYQTRSNESSERDLQRNLISGSEREKLAYLSLLTGKTSRTLSLHLQSAPNNAAARDLAITTVLQRKGRALDAMTNTIATLRRHAAAEDQALLDQLAEARSQFAALSLKGAPEEGAEKYRAALAALEEKVDQLESQISSRSAEFRAQSTPITLKAVQRAIPAEAILVEFTTYRPYDVKRNVFGRPRYAAYIIGNQGEAQWVELGNAEVINHDIGELRKALRDVKRNDVKNLARVVDAKVMEPIRHLLAGERASGGVGEKGSGGAGEKGNQQTPPLPHSSTPLHVFLSPDGALNLLPFAALIDEHGEYLVKNYSFTYLTSGRDLLRLQSKTVSRQGGTIFADPDFNNSIAAPSANADTRVAQRVSRNEPHPATGPKIGEVEFQPLERLISTLDEAAGLKKSLPDARVLTGREASKTAIKSLSSPAILHIATHGFFLEDQMLTEDSRGLSVRAQDDDAGAVAAEVISQNPLLRSGLFFAGANVRQGDGGILTALEVAGLDLWGTKLVVLSACDTGVGQVKNGDGVYGLRRALLLAGSESQVMSLWSVSDQGTSELMIDYYKRLRAGEGRSAALRQAQLQMLAKSDRQHPYYWASFIQSGEWANLDGKR